MTHPLVSIIVPSFNQGRFIRDTIESCLAQDYRPIEVLVIDGASKDETVEVLHRYDGVPEVTWVSEPDRGVVEAVNKGFARARGEVGGIQSSDDYYLPGAIRKAVEELRADPGLGFVFGDIVKVDQNGQELTRTVLKQFSVGGVLSLQTWIPQPSCFFRMDLAKRLGGWRESVPYAPDTDLWFRIMLQAGGRKVDRFWAKRRVHEAQRDRHGPKILRDYAQMQKDFFEIYGAPTALRPAAEAGYLLMQNRYHSQESQAIKFQRCRQAIRLYPELKGQLILPSRIPGLDLARRILRRLAKMLGAAIGTSKAKAAS